VVGDVYGAVRACGQTERHVQQGLGGSRSDFAPDGIGDPSYDAESPREIADHDERVAAGACN
jgi:hypothetical protein